MITSSRAHVEFDEHGSGSLTLDGKVHLLRANDVHDARDTARTLITERAAALDIPIITTATEPEGTWTIQINPDGSVCAPTAPEPPTEAAPTHPPAPEPAHLPTPPIYTPSPAPPVTLAEPTEPPPPDIDGAPWQRPVNSHTPNTDTHPVVTKPDNPIPASSVDVVTPTHASHTDSTQSRRELRSQSLLTQVTNEPPAETGLRGILNALGGN